MIGDSELTAKALRTAALFHKDETRKGKEIPYIVHPVEVAMYLQENGMNEEVIAAGLLHDTLENTEMTETKLKNKFSDRVAELVVGASEKLENREETSWKERKEHTVEYLKEAEWEIQILSCADKLSNVKSMRRDYKEEEDKLWDRFNEGYEKQKWYYTSLVKSLKDLAGNDIYEEFKMTVESFDEDEIIW